MGVAMDEHVDTSRRKILIAATSAVGGIGVEIQGGTPQEYAALIMSDLAKWCKVVKEAGIQPE